MRKQFIIIAALLCALPGYAQDDRTSAKKVPQTAVSTSPEPVTTAGDDDLFMSAPRFNGEAIDLHDTGSRPYGTAKTDTVSLNLPAVDQLGQARPLGIYPYGWGGWSNWRLHKGLNVSLGAAVSAQFGHGAMSGVGFSQNISAMYVMPLSNKLSIAVGGYFTNMDWGRYSYREAGVNAMLGYRFNDHWEGYVYAQKSITGSRHMPMPLYDMNALGDRIGAAVRYNFSPSFSIQLNVESNSRPSFSDAHDFYMQAPRH